MKTSKWWTVYRVVIAAVAIAILASLPCSSPAAPASWQIYVLHEGSFVQSVSSSPVSPPYPHASPTSQIPPTWRVTAAALADVTGDGASEWVLLVWRPWRDWPIQSWLPAPSPIAGFHDAAGDSCHLILLDPADGREIWAGSALPAPLLALAVGDVDGDGHNEVVTLEGNYAAGRYGPAAHVSVWRWNGFGFTLQYRSPPGVFRELRLTDQDKGGILSIAVR